MEGLTYLKKWQNTESGPYKAGTVLRITATPNDGYEFIGWTGSNETSMEITTTVNSDGSNSKL